MLAESSVVAHTLAGDKQCGGGERGARLVLRLEQAILCRCKRLQREQLAAMRLREPALVQRQGSAATSSIGRAGAMRRF
jgi:hypothetical protein